MEDKALIKSTRVITAATLLSRLLGFVRDVVIAGLFGTGSAAQAFVVAFRIPNLLRSLVGEGAAGSAFVPVLSRLDARGRSEEFWSLCRSLLNILLLVLALLTLLGEVFAPYIVRLIAPGFINDPEKLYLTVRLTRFIFPYIFLIGLTAYAMAVLNSLRHFALPALAPALLNISLIVSALVFCPRMEIAVDGLAIGVLIGGFLQAALQLPLLLKKGLFKRKAGPFFHPRVKEVGRLFLPRTLGAAVYQVNLFVDTIFASLTLIVGEGAAAAFQYANRMVQFPLALFAIALSQAALPGMSALALQNDFSGLRRTVSFSLRSVFVIMLPATTGLLVLGRPLIQVIFERGSFTAYSTDITALVLSFYCLGLSGYAGIKILTGAFYALKDTATPAKTAFLALLVNVLLNLLLMRPLKMAGLALATAISVSFNFILLFMLLQKRLGRIEHFGRGIMKVAAVCLAMGLALWALFYRSSFFLGSKGLPAFKLGIVILAAGAGYLPALRWTAKEEAQLLSRWIFRRR